MISVRTINGNPMTFVAECEGEEIGRMQVTIVPLVHDMDLKPSFLQRKAAEALYTYAAGYVKASGFHEALMMVADDNTKMQAWIKSVKFCGPEPSQVYMLAVE